MGKVGDTVIIFVNSILFSLVATTIAGFYVGIDKCYLDQSAEPEMECGRRDKNNNKLSGECNENSTRFVAEWNMSESWMNMTCPSEPESIQEAKLFGYIVAGCYIGLMSVVFTATLNHDWRLCYKAHKSNLWSHANASSSFKTAGGAYLVTGCYCSVLLLFSVIWTVRIGILFSEDTDFSLGCVCRCKWAVNIVRQVQGVVYPCFALLLSVALCLRWYSLKKGGRPAFLSTTYTVPVEKVICVTKNTTTPTYLDP